MSAPIPSTSSQGDAKAPVSPAVKAALDGLGTSETTEFNLLSMLNPLNWFHKPKASAPRDDEAYQAGETYSDPEVLATGLVEDLQAIGLSASPKQIAVLIDVLKNKGKPVNDREMTMEKMIALVSALPRTSESRKKLTGVIIDGLWSSLQHPPLSYLGDKYQYRTPDGSYNNPLQPDLGKAGTPYAKTVKKLKHLKGTPPDPGLLFDFLMARTPESFKENPAGISSMLFYHATIIIHDIFRSNRFDNRISDTSSYLDLAPLYGSNLEDQIAVRAMTGGLLKPDTFSEKRLLGQPPGVNAILVMYSRFHNYVAETLLKINEYGRFTLPPTPDDKAKAKALVKQDEDLFQTARLITNGLYVNISLHDYLRGLTNTHHSLSDWTLDPRVDVSRTFDKDGVPKGIGNQVSAEFNLLYRFHSTISLRDEKWTNEFLQSLFPGNTKPLDQLTPEEFVMGLFTFEQSIPTEPSKREFGGIKRGANGKFDDGALVKILTESMEDPAGLFGARMVPKALKVIEIAGILSARKWQLASLNEMREHFGLTPHKTFKDLNPDPEIGDLLQKFYQDPDMVEMYPGLFLEDGKPRMDPGCGGCPPYTVGRAVFSDAVTLVRSDRFLTLDYTASTLTNWGMEEVRQDLDVLGGSMFYKLFQRALPYWYPFNSLHIMQPMFTRKMNEEIARELGTIEKYSLAGPAPPPQPVVIFDKENIKKVLSDQANFIVPWFVPFKAMFGGRRKYEDYMLGGDTAAHTAQRKMLYDIVYRSPEGTVNLLVGSAISYAEAAMKTATMTLSKDLIQFDLIRDVGIPVITRLLCNMFNLNLRSPDNPGGDLNTATMYKHLMNVRTWGFNDLDIAMSWKRRMWAEKSALILTDSTAKTVEATLNSSPGSKKDLWSFGETVVRDMAAAGKTQAEIVDIAFLTAVAGVGVTQSLVAEVLGFFLKKENAELWGKLQTLANDKDVVASTTTIRKYVQEAQRITSTQRDVRLCKGPVDLVIKGQPVKVMPGARVALMLGLAGSTFLPDAAVFKIDRPADEYLSFGWGPHQCLGREVALSFTTAMIKVLAGMKNLRPAPGDMGVLKSIKQGTETYYLNDSWSYLTTDPTTWTLHFEGYGPGIYTPPPVSVNTGRNLDALFNALKTQDKEDSAKAATPAAAAPAKS